MKEMAERIQQLEEGLAARHAEYVRLARKEGVSVLEYHPLLQEHYTKIKKAVQYKPSDSVQSRWADRAARVSNDELVLVPRAHDPGL